MLWFSNLQIFTVGQPKDRLVHYIAGYGFLCMLFTFYKFFLTFASLVIGGYSLNDCMFILSLSVLRKMYFFISGVAEICFSYLL